MVASDERHFGLTGNQIKFILIVLMLVDHTVTILYDGSDTIRAIAVGASRVVAPGMIYFLVEGYIHTHNLRQYIIRMAVVAIISQFTFSYAFSTPLIPSKGEYFYQELNVIWGLLWGLLVMAAVFSESNRVKWWMKAVFYLIALLVSIPADFMAVAVIAAPLMYYYREHFWIKMMALAIPSFLINFGCHLYWTGDFEMALIMGAAVLLIIPLFLFYNGKRGKWMGMKWFYYLFYPIHLFVLGFIGHIS